MNHRRRQTRATRRQGSVRIPSLVAAHLHTSKYMSGLVELSFLEDQLAGGIGQTGASV